MTALSIEEIRKLKKKTDCIILEPQCILIIDIDNRIKRLFEVDKTDPLVFHEIDVKAMVQRIAAYLSQHITLESLVKDKLLHEPIETILDLHTRIEKKAKIKEHKGCYYLEVKGKKGKPLELDL